MLTRKNEDAKELIMWNLDATLRRIDKVHVLHASRLHIRQLAVEGMNVLCRVCGTKSIQKD